MLCSGWLPCGVVRLPAAAQPQHVHPAVATAAAAAVVAVVLIWRLAVAAAAAAVRCPHVRVVLEAVAAVGLWRQAAAAVVGTEQGVTAWWGLTGCAAWG